MPLHWPVLPIALVCAATAAQPVVYDFTFMGNLDDEYFNPYNWYPLSVPNNTPEYECRVFLQATATINPHRTVVLHSFFGDYYLRLENASLTIEHELASGSLSVRDGSSLRHLGNSPITVGSWYTYDTGFSSSNTTEIVGRFQSPSLGASGQAVALFPNVTRIANAPGTQSSSSGPYLAASLDSTTLVRSRLSLPSLTEWPDGLKISMGGGRIELDSITSLDRVTLNYSSKGELGELYAPLLSELGGSQFNVWAPDVSFLAPSQSSGFEIDVHSGGIAFPGLERITDGVLEMTVNSNRTFYTANASFPDLDYTPGDSGVLKVYGRGFGDDEKVKIRFGSLTQIPPYSTFHAVGNDTHFDLPSVTVAESVQINDGIGNNQTTLGPLTSINNSALYLGTFGDISHPISSIKSDLATTRLIYRNASSVSLPNLSTIQTGAGSISLSSGGDLRLPSLQSFHAPGGRGASLIAGGSLIAPNLTTLQFLDSESGQYITGGITLAAGNAGVIQIPSITSLHSSTVSLGQNASWSAPLLESLTDTSLTLAAGAQLLAPSLRTITGGEIDINGTTALPDQIESITDTDIVVRGPDEESEESPISFGSGISPVFQDATITKFGKVEYGYTTLRGSVYLYRGPRMPNLQHIETNPAPGLYPSITFQNGNSEQRDIDLSNLEELPPGVQIWTMFDVTIGGDVRSNLLSGRFGTYYIEGDVIPGPMPYDHKYYTEVRDVRFALVGEGTQRFEVFTGAVNRIGWRETAQLMIGDGLRPLDVIMSNDVINRRNPPGDALKLRAFRHPALEIQPGARLFLNNTEVLLDENLDGTYVTLESLIPPGQNCVEYDRGLLCRQRCTSDTNRDGLTDFGDIQAFIDLYLAGDLAADFNNDGLLDSGDFVAFVDAFLLGC